MNWPVTGASDEYDLRFVDDESLGYRWTDSLGQAAESIDTDVTVGGVEVLPTDLGGWGTLRVIAELEDGGRSSAPTRASPTFESRGASPAAQLLHIGWSRTVFRRERPMAATMKLSRGEVEFGVMGSVCMRNTEG